LALELFKALQQRYGACNELLQPEQSDPELRATFIWTRSNTSIAQEHVVQLGNGNRVLLLLHVGMTSLLCP
jgi:hypothetical protein